MIWGRLIGTILGFKTFGILGAFIGYIAGSWFDKGLTLNLYHIPRSRSVAVQQAFFKATFLVMGHLAKADGTVSEDEIRVARRIMSRLDLNADLKQEAMQLFSEGKNSAFNLEQTLENLYQECKSYPDLLRFFIEIQLEAALADGELHPEGRRILGLICQKLHFSAAEFEQLWARQWASQAFNEWFTAQFNRNASSSGFNNQYRFNQRYAGAGQHQQQQRTRSSYTNATSMQDAYGVLGVSPSASVADIKKAYRKLMNQHHPDKLAARGLPEGMMKLAKEKTQQITAAYNLIREAKGFR